MERGINTRKRYLDKVRPFIGKQLIKVFTGQRRVGKSYVLKLLIIEIKQKDPQANIIYINKEDMAFEFIETAADLHQHVQKHTIDGVMNYVLVDEIQEIKAFEKAMRSLLLHPFYDLYCTGSNANMLSSELATFLSGRYIEIPIYSLSYTEFLDFHQRDNNDSTLMDYLKFGGLPYLKHLALTNEVVFGYLKGVYNTIIYRDVVMRNDIRNTTFLENLVLFIADNIGHLFSSKKISDYLKVQKINITPSQIINYLNYLTNAYLVYKVKRFDIVGKKLFDVGEKFYFQDLGLRNAVIDYKQPDIGKLIENAVFNHLQYLGYDVKIGQLGSAEIDFIGKRNGELLYVQVCYLLQEQATIDREFGNLERIKDNYPKMVVSMDNFSGNSYHGIQHVYLRDFLSLEN